MTGKEVLDAIYIKLENYITNLNDTYNDLIQNDLDEELEWSANEIMNEKIIVLELMYKIPKLEKELELLTKYKRAFEILKEKFYIESFRVAPNYRIYIKEKEYGNDEISILLSKEEYELLEELMKDE